MTGTPVVQPLTIHTASRPQASRIVHHLLAEQRGFQVFNALGFAALVIGGIPLEEGSQRAFDEGGEPPH